MTDIIKLAERCETEAGSRGLDGNVALAVVGSCRRGCRAYTTSLDAALTLVGDDDAHEVMREAVSAVGRKFDLHMDTWPGDASYRHELAKAFCAAALRARAGEG